MRELSPFSKRSALMRPVFDEFDGLFNKFFGDPFFSRLENKSNFPKFNIFEKDGEFVVEALVADTPKDKISVSLDRDILTIQGESNQNKEVDEDNYHVREISRRAFSRSLKLPDDLIDQKPKTSLRDGVLRIAFKYPEHSSISREKKIIEIE